MAHTFVHYLSSVCPRKVYFLGSSLRCLCGSRCWAPLECRDQFLLHALRPLSRHPPGEELCAWWVWLCGQTRKGPPDPTHYRKTCDGDSAQKTSPGHLLNSPRGTASSRPSQLDSPCQCPNIKAVSFHWLRGRQGSEGPESRRCESFTALLNSNAVTVIWQSASGKQSITSAEI